MGTLPVLQNLAKHTSRISEIEKKVLAFGEIAKESGWMCDDIPQNYNANEADIQSSIRQQGVPERIISTFTDSGKLKKTSALKAVEKFMTTPREAWCLVLSGPKGCGKSTAAAHYLMKNTHGTIESLPKTQRWWTSANISRVSSYREELESLMRIPILVIDDLGVEYIDKNGFFLSRLDELIDARWGNFKRTIITTNLNRKDFQDRYDQRITDRIRQGFKDGADYLEVTDCKKSLRA